jgi:hypothetical protein
LFIPYIFTASQTSQLNLEYEKKVEEVREQYLQREKQREKEKTQFQLELSQNYQKKVNDLRLLEEQFQQQQVIFYLCFIATYLI